MGMRRTRRIGRIHGVENRRDRVVFATDAGLGRVSGISVLAGTLVACGAFLVMVAIADGIVAAIGIDRSSVSGHFHRVAVGGGIAVAVALFVSYVFGGYVAGRMARRAGVTNGLMVFVLSLVIAAVIGGAIAVLGGASNVADAIGRTGLPTTAQRWRTIGTFAGIGALAAILLGSLTGGSLGDRWHTKLARRAMDPAIGPTADETPATTATAATATARPTAEDRDDQVVDVTEQRDEQTPETVAADR